ncbi:MAG: response regulator, partial [Thermodesulfobacteriota bacterium]
MRRSVRTMLRMARYDQKILETGNGKEAWKFLQKNKVDLIIADYNLPGMNGVELLRNVRGNKEIRDTLFLIITAETNREVVAEAAEYDVDGYLALPFDSATLGKTIDSILTRARSPEPMIVHLRAALKLKEEGKIYEAIKETKKAAAANPDTSRPLRELGKLYLGSNNKKEAIKCFQRSIALNQLDISSHYHLGRIFVEEDKVDQAVQH